MFLNQRISTQWTTGKPSELTEAEALKGTHTKALVKLLSPKSTKYDGEQTDATWEHTAAYDHVQTKTGSHKEVC